MSYKIPGGPFKSLEQVVEIRWIFPFPLILHYQIPAGRPRPLFFEHFLFYNIQRELSWKRYVCIDRPYLKHCCFGNCLAKDCLKRIGLAIPALAGLYPGLLVDAQACFLASNGWGKEHYIGICCLLLLSWNLRSNGSRWDLEWDLERL